MGKKVDWLKGIITPIVTPFDDDENLDEQALRNVVDFQVEKGVHALFPLGYTGEFFRLSLAERKRVIEIVVDQANGRIPVLPGCHTLSTKLSIELARHAKDVGANGVVVLQPYAPPPLSDDNLYGHYKDLNDAVDIPIMIYSEAGIVNEHSVELIERLMNLSNVIGIKFSTNDIARFQSGLQLFGHKTNVLAGEEPMFVPGMLAGGVGGVLMTSNFAPEYWVKIYDLTTKGNWKDAMEMQKKFLNAARYSPWAFTGDNDVVKEALNLRGIRVGRARRPGRVVTPRHTQVMETMLTSLDLTHA